MRFYEEHLMVAEVKTSLGSALAFCPQTKAALNLLQSKVVECLALCVYARNRCIHYLQTFIK